MMDIFVGAAPGSNVSDAELTISGEGFSTALKVSAGGYARAQVTPSTPNQYMDINLSVLSKDKQVTVYAHTIPVDANISVLGTDALRFDGQILHNHPKTSNPAPACSLRCTPTDTPTQGPGCKECSAKGLVFRVCC
jgi:hypothetical protein